VLDESLTLVQSLGIFLLVIGAYALETKPHHSLLEPIRTFMKGRYYHYILIAIVLYTVTGTLDRVILHHYDMQPQAYMAIVHVLIALYFIMLLNLFHDGVKGIRHGLRRAGWWILLVAVFTFAYRFATVEAVKVGFVGLVVSIKRVSSLFTTILGGELFHEKNLFRRFIACAIMIIGALMIAL
jgi:uncharacterized membrane protein